jgi:hypothetical protein
MATTKKPTPKKPVAKRSVKKAPVSKATPKSAVKKAVAKKPVAAKTTKKSGGKKKHIVRRILDFKIKGWVSRKAIIIGGVIAFLFVGGFAGYAVWQNMSANAGGLTTLSRGGASNTIGIYNPNPIDATWLAKYATDMGVSDWTDTSATQAGGTGTVKHIITAANACRIYTPDRAFSYKNYSGYQIIGFIRTIASRTTQTTTRVDHPNLTVAAQVYYPGSNFAYGAASPQNQIIGKAVAGSTIATHGVYATLYRALANEKVAVLPLFDDPTKTADASGQKTFISYDSTPLNGTVGYYRYIAVSAIKDCPTGTAKLAGL